MHVMGRTGTRAWTGQSCLDFDFAFDFDFEFEFGEDEDDVEVEDEVEWDDDDAEPMVSVLDLDWKRVGSLGYFIVWICGG